MVDAPTVDVTGGRIRGALVGHEHRATAQHGGGDDRCGRHDGRDRHVAVDRAARIELEQRAVEAPLDADESESRPRCRAFHRRSRVDRDG